MKNLFKGLLILCCVVIVWRSAVLSAHVDMLLCEAGRLEREYEWPKVIEKYEEAVTLASKYDISKIDDIFERLGNAYYRSAMQAESLEEFRNRIHLAIVNYEKSRELHEGLHEPERTPRSLRSTAMIAYLGYWLASDVHEKKRLLDDCWKNANEALKGFESAEDAPEYGKTFNQILVAFPPKFHLEWDYHAREKILRGAIELGERAIRFLPISEDQQLTRAYAGTSACLAVFVRDFLDPDDKERGRYYQKVMDYWLKARELSEETAFIELLSVFGSGPWAEGSNEALGNFQMALNYGRKTRDKFIIGSALDSLAHNTFWKTTQDPDEGMALAKRALDYAEEADHYYSTVSFTSVTRGTVWAGAPQAEYHSRLAYIETNLSKRREILEVAAGALPELLKRAESSGCPDNITYAHHISRMVYRNLAEVTEDSEEKRSLLERALAHGNEASRIFEQTNTHDYWNRGIMQGGLARIKYLLAGLTKDSETRKNMIKEAVLDLETARRLGTKEHASLSIESSFPFLGGLEYTFGVWLNRLYELTNNREHLRAAAEAFEEATEKYKKVNLTSRAAESYWKAAQTYDMLGDNLKAAEDFGFASTYYAKTAEKISQLKDFYQDHALYMQAWSEIEKARHHHKRQEYGPAQEHFERTADLHRSLKQWSYLAPNYTSWAKVEQAEELSRSERCEEAIQTFKQATNLFEETKKSLQTQFSKIEDLDEKQMATNIIKVTDLRRGYCMARITLEEAKILDKKGDHSLSSEKYDSAAEAFQKMTLVLMSEQDRKEFKLITTLSRAWARMTQAEAEESSNLYLQASQLFAEAKELSTNEKAKMLALGHSRLCKALEAGTKFADTRDVSLHEAFTRHLESASNYYIKAGLKSASEYAKATGLLFDAYVHMDKAQRENDPEKKAKLYTIAEKVLQTSADLYMRAEHPEKREQVLRLLDDAEEGRELALSLSDVLHAPSIVSTTTAFNTPTPNEENAVGLERFESADLQASITSRRKELKVGESLELELDLVNAGKSPAILIKIIELIPAGFELTEKPEICREEDTGLNMKGKRLGPLKTEEVKLVLKPRVQGTFPLKPRILYLDERGKYKSHELEPVTITVKELGIKGWLKG